MLLITTLLIMSLELPHSAPPSHSTVLHPSLCSDSTSVSRMRVGTLLAVARSTELPGRLRDLSRVEAAELRMLNDAEDRALCERIRRLTLDGRRENRITGRPWFVAVYEGGGFYFAVVSTDLTPASGNARDGSATVLVGGSGGWMSVFDGNLEHLTTTRG